ncbi:MAG: ATP-grasp domain-containing protein [Promethearchaeota archaeon]
MPKIGIITDTYHLKYKLTKLLDYLKDKAQVNFYVEEDFLLSFDDLRLDEDVFFVKTKGNLALTLVRYIERETSIPVFNSYKGICLAINRFLNSLYLRKNGIPVPNFGYSPYHLTPPFENYIIKNAFDQRNIKFKPEIKIKNGKIQVIDKRALINSTEENFHINYHYYYQEFIKSDWEYKIYGIDEKLFFYRQIPVLIEPDKMKSRVKIEEIPLLKEISLKAMKTLDLKITSIDFLKSDDERFYLTDINCMPNFNYIKEGPKLIGDFLIHQAKI